jgi:hypothetical protein
MRHTIPALTIDGMAFFTIEFKVRIDTDQGIHDRCHVKDLTSLEHTRPNNKKDVVTMMKFPNFVPLIILVALTTTLAQAQEIPTTHDTHKRFEQMDHKMDEAWKSHGKERQGHMHEHMQMMHTQMQAMHAMMGGGQMGSGGHRPGGQMGPGGDQRMQHMQSRMDMMQKMMEQMQKQHELMLKDDNHK